MKNETSNFSRILDSRTLVPIGAVLVLLSSLIGGTAWLTAMYNKSEAQATIIREYQFELEKIREKQAGMSDRIYGVQIELEAIRGKLDGITKLLERR
jgi:hypothetical protein